LAEPDALAYRTSFPGFAAPAQTFRTAPEHTTPFTLQLGTPAVLFLSLQVSHSKSLTPGTSDGGSTSPEPVFHIMNALLRTTIWSNPVFPHTGHGLQAEPECSEKVAQDKGPKLLTNVAQGINCKDGARVMRDADKELAAPYAQPPDLMASHFL